MLRRRVASLVPKAPKGVLVDGEYVWEGNGWYVSIKYDLAEDTDGLVVVTANSQEQWVHEFVVSEGEMTDAFIVEVFEKAECDVKLLLTS